MNLKLFPQEIYCKPVKNQEISSTEKHMQWIERAVCFLYNRYRQNLKQMHDILEEKLVPKHEISQYQCMTFYLEPIHDTLMQRRQARFETAYNSHNIVLDCFTSLYRSELHMTHACFLHDPRMLIYEHSTKLTHDVFNTIRWRKTLHFLVERLFCMTILTHIRPMHDG